MSTRYSVEFSSGKNWASDHMFKTKAAAQKRCRKLRALGNRCRVRKTAWGWATP